jgi:hypothetical protein
VYPTSPGENALSSSAGSSERRDEARREPKSARGGELAVDQLNARREHRRERRKSLLGRAEVINRDNRRSCDAWNRYGWTLVSYRDNTRDNIHQVEGLVRDNRVEVRASSPLSGRFRSPGGHISRRRPGLVLGLRLF